MEIIILNGCLSWTVCKCRTRLGVSKTHFKMDVVVDWIQLLHTFILDMNEILCECMSRVEIKIISRLFTWKPIQKFYECIRRCCGSNNKQPPNGVCRFVCIYVKRYTNSSRMCSRRIGNDAVRVERLHHLTQFHEFMSVRMPCQVSPIRSGASFTEIHSTFEPTVVIHVAPGEYDWHLEKLFSKLIVRNNHIFYSIYIVCIWTPSVTQSVSSRQKNFDNLIINS